MAICQNKPVYDKNKNIDNAFKMIKKASDNKAGLVVLPEIFYYPYEIKKLKAIADDNTALLKKFCGTAKDLSIFICTGSMAVKDKDKIFNRAYLINPEGKIVLVHDKCHLFNVDLPHLTVLESEIFSKGSDINIVETELGKIGMLICYDIRFPEIARKLALKGAEIILVPAAFNNITGPAHWEIMFRARAVENQIYIAAASPARNSKTGYKAYGHSMIIDPWGKILSEAKTGEKIIYADLDPDILIEKRKILPLLRDRREEIY